MDVFKCPFTGKASLHILKACPFPKYIIEIGVEGVLAEIKKAVKKTVGIKKATELYETAKESIGVDYGEEAARCKIRTLVEALELLNSQLENIEAEMAVALSKTGIAEYLLSLSRKTEKELTAADAERN